MTRHRLDIVSLLAGLVITAIAVLALNPGWSGASLEWVWPSILVGGGVVALAATLMADRRVPRDAEPVDDIEGVGEVAPHHLEAGTLDEARAEVEDADPFMT